MTHHMATTTKRQKDKLIEAAQNAIEFTVRGTGEFPTDMLRYDCCWPATEAARPGPEQNWRHPPDRPEGPQAADVRSLAQLQLGSGRGGRLMPALIKCCYCRDAISPIDGEWVGHGNASADCTHAPGGKHARQLVINATPTNQPTRSTAHDSTNQ